ncbi:MAG: protein phosphatase 2C domain-containing protein [Vicinamibacterales bacterium]
MIAAAEAGGSLRAAGATDVGRQRSLNEDRFHVDLTRGVFIVVDGVGGHAAGDRAADTAIAAMTGRLARETGPVVDRVREAITIANNEIHRLAATRADWLGMACVLTAAVVDGDRVVVGHVGDSRLYRLHDGQIEKITPDHSPIGEREDARELSEAEAMRHPRRNEVYRDVGSEPHEVGDPDFVFLTETDIPAGGALLICSDGLSDLVPSETIQQIATAHAGSPDDVARALIDAANSAGGKDNVTVVYVERERRRGGQPSIAIDPPPGRSGSTRRTVALVASLAAVGGFVLGGLFAQVVGWPGTEPGSVLRPAGAAAIVVVRPGESISTALAEATPGTQILVEPGEYRERLTLVDHVRVISRVPRGATLRLPPAATENDAAVTAAGISNAELIGFRIVGDAATPLGTGVLLRNATVRLLDLEVTGAIRAAFDLGAGDGVVLSGSDIHGNPGAALILRAGASSRLSNNAFSSNAASERSPGMIVIEAGTSAAWSHNVFSGVTPQSLAGLDTARRAEVASNNWFVRSEPVRPASPGAAGRGRAR